MENTVSSHWSQWPSIGIMIQLYPDLMDAYFFVVDHRATYIGIGATAIIIVVLLIIIILYQRFRFNRDAADRLQEIDKMKSRFFANISHEFRTPLTLILGPIESLLNKLDEADIKKDLIMMQRNARQLLRLINQILDLAKLEAGKLKLNAGKNDFIKFIKSVIMSFESLAAQRNIKLAFENNIQMDLPGYPLYFNHEKLEQAFNNLLSNAFKFTPDNGQVSVSISPVSEDISRRSTIKDFVEVRIIDRGIAIPADMLPHVFDRYYQVESAIAVDQEGSGIGLALVKEFVELHHGNIVVKSEKSKGTEFIIQLPIGKSHLKEDEIIEDDTTEDFTKENISATQTSDQTTRDTNTKDDKTSDTDKTIILVVEDNPDVRIYIRDHLEAAYHVIEAEDGEQGIREAIETVPDLIISDVMVPKKDGYEVCKTLKTNEKTSHIPVILLTAKAAMEEKLEGLETGADDYLIKPFNSKELLTRIKNLIELRHKLRERFKDQVVLKPSEVAVTSTDQAFLEKALNIVEENISDEEFSVEYLRQAVAMSRTQLHRKLKALTNQSGNQFIQSVRIQRALELLNKKFGTIAEIAYEVGFGDPSYFTRAFQKHFGKTPSEYVNE